MNKYCGNPTNSAYERGFSLVQLSVIIAVTGVLVAASLPGGKEQSIIGQTLTTAQKLEKIEQALGEYKAAFGALPCPANATLASDHVNYGRQADNPGQCTGGAIASTFGPSGTGDVVAGMIPIRTLHLPDEYAYDAHNNRFTYAVDSKLTTNFGCKYYTAKRYSGGLSISNGAATPTLQQAMAAIISHGEDGHGSFPINGSTIANVNNANSGDASELENASQNADFSTNFNQTFVKKGKTGTYDDLVNVQNTCCKGTKCEYDYHGPDLVVGQDVGVPTLNTYMIDRETNALYRDSAPDPLPTTYTIGDVKFSFDNDYLNVVCSAGAVGNRVYKFNGNNFYDLNIAGLSVTQCAPAIDNAFSPDGLYLATVYDNSMGGGQKWRVYKRSGDSFTLIPGWWAGTKPDVRQAAGQTISGLHFSHDSKYLALTTGPLPGIYVYKIDAADNFVSVPIPTLNGQGAAIEFSPDDKYLAAMRSSSTETHIYKVDKSTDPWTFTKITGAGGLAPAPAAQNWDMAWSPDAKYLAIGSWAAPRVSIYRVDPGDVFTKLANPASLPGSTVLDLSFSADGKYLALGLQNSPYLMVYSIGAGDVFTNITIPASLRPPGMVRSLHFRHAD